VLPCFEDLDDIQGWEAGGPSPSLRGVKMISVRGDIVPILSLSRMLSDPPGDSDDYGEPEGSSPIKNFRVPIVSSPPGEGGSA
jgi:hypothetical protein